MPTIEFRKNRPTLILTVGLPASGKTTFAKEVVRTAPNRDNFVRANRDDIRKMLYDQAFCPNEEGTVTLVQDAIITAALVSGRNVIVDDTNLNPRTMARLRVLADDHGATVEVVDFRHVPLATCLSRDADRKDPVGEEVIMRMYEKYVKGAK